MEQRIEGLRDVEIWVPALREAAANRGQERWVDDKSRFAALMRHFIAAQEVFQGRALYLGLFQWEGASGSHTALGKL